MSVGIGRIWLWWAGCVEFGRALALAMAASPNEVSSATLASVDFMFLLSELTYVTIRNVMFCAVRYHVQSD